MNQAALESGSGRKGPFSTLPCTQPCSQAGGALYTLQMLWPAENRMFALHTQRPPGSQSSPEALGTTLVLVLGAECCGLDPHTRPTRARLLGSALLFRHTREDAVGGTTTRMTRTTSPTFPSRVSLALLPTRSSQLIPTIPPPTSTGRHSLTSVLTSFCSRDPSPHPSVLPTNPACAKLSLPHVVPAVARASCQQLPGCLPASAQTAGLTLGCTDPLALKTGPKICISLA